ncbi:MAG TPA: DUF6655 family protein [Dongiaceae bacterium]|nr:DUF6655 family protein [Dongiaceae bacterium]
MPILVVVVACSSERETQPARTASEQLMISSAVDHALDRLHVDIPRGTRIWVNADNFEGYDQKYAVGAIRDHLLRQGALLVADKGQADTIVEIRSGALSTDENSMLIGIPSMALPVPFVGATSTPELSLLKRSNEKGVAKIGVTAYDAKTGAMAPYSPAQPAYGFSDRTRWVVFSLIDWSNSDTLPENVEDESGADEGK